jgi:PAS domain S-box-containing protein/putative nucleotidyltransferase with HDIG domain
MKVMSQTLRVLIVEDSEDDALLVVRELKHAGYDVTFERVETAEAMRAALANQEWDVVLSDYSLPQFGGPAALAMLKESGLDLPFILASGTIGEETAVAALKAGAHDFLLKSQLARLVPAVERELREAASRRERRQAEAALAASEAELRALFASMRDVVLVIDRDGIYRKIAPTTPAAWYIPPQELLGKRLQDVFPAEQAEAFYRAIRQVLDTKQSAQIEYELTAGGQAIWYEASISQLDADNTLWVAHDVTERKRSEDALREAEERYRVLVEQAPAITYVVSAQAPYATLYVSPQIETTLGYTPEEWKADPELWAKRLHPEDRERILALDQNSNSSSQSFSAEYRLLAKDGRVVWLQDHTHRVLNEKGEGLSTQGIEFDITERKRTEQAEREQRTLAEALRDTAAALNSTLDFDEVLERILLNAERVVPHQSSSIMLVEGDVVRAVKGRGYAERGTETWLMAQRFPLRSLTNRTLMLDTRQPVVVPDTREFPGWHKFPETGWIRSHVAAPIVVKGNVIGFINLDSDQPGFFTPADGARLQAFAEQAAVALENARLLTGIRQGLTELETLHTVSSALRLAQTREEALPILLDETLTALGTEAGVIWLYHYDSNELRIAIARGWFKELADIPRRPGEGIAGTVFASGQTHISPDFAQDPLGAAPARGAQFPPGWGGACLPIRHGTTTVGVWFVSVPLPRQMAPQQVKLLESLAEMAGAALHRMHLYEQTEQRLRQVDALHAIDVAISASMDLKTVLNVVLDKVAAELGADAAGILLLHPQRQTLEYAAGRGFRTQIFKGTQLRLGEGYAGRATLERHAIYIPDLAEQSDNPRLAKHLTAESFRAYYGVPLIAKGQVVGVLEIFQRSPLPADHEWVAFLETLSGQAAIAIENAQLFDGLQRSNLDLALAYDATIEGWSRALDLRDKETEGHTLRTTELTERLARVMGLRDADLVHIRRGALLHDIGKMGVPDNILLKPSPLTDDEWVLMRKHPVHAYEMLAPITYLKPALDIPYCHHEKWDGTGYPRGLKGEQIPLAARLFAVVDVWDALRSDRPYRAAWPEKKVLEHIRSLAGSHFDPQAVEAFLKLPSEGRASGAAAARA